MNSSKSNIEIYKTVSGETEIEVNLDEDTVWASENDLIALFGKSRRTIGYHIKNIYAEGELDKNSTWRNFRQVQKEGLRDVIREISLYNLDLIISVGFRVNSKEGILFRIWAANVLKNHLVEGFSLNEKRLREKEMEVEILKSGIQIVNRALEEKANHEGFEYLRLFAQGLTLLDDYDHENLDEKGFTHIPAIYPELYEYNYLIDEMKTEFNSDIFGLEKDKSFESAVAQISKGYKDSDFYPSVEEKATTLLYLIVKNHAFTDGNKRIGAACFLMFLQRNKLLTNEIGKLIISNEALASLTLFIASSKPEEMETVKKLVISILNRNRNK